MRNFWSSFHFNSLCSHAMTCSVGNEVSITKMRFLCSLVVVVGCGIFVIRCFCLSNIQAQRGKEFGSCSFLSELLTKILLILKAISNLNLFWPSENLLEVINGASGN